MTINGMTIENLKMMLKYNGENIVNHSREVKCNIMNRQNLLIKNNTRL